MSLALRPITCILFAFLLTSPLCAGEVRIYRDTWGVPHIHGKTPAEVMYGFGYAQAEDRLEAILKNYLTATGRMAEVFGPDHYESDFRQRLYQHEQIASTHSPHPQVRSLIAHFVAGQIAYLNTHPERVPSWAFRPEPHHVIALARYLAFQALENQAHQEWTGSDPAHQSGGNQWVVSRDHAANDAVLLNIDLFHSWHTPLRFYEAHLHGGNLHAFGFTHPGLPVFVVGHNNTLGWSTLPGGPDCVDIYEIDLPSPNATRYESDGTWQTIQTDTLLIGIRIHDQIEQRVTHAQHTAHGPILHRQGKKAYAYRFSLASETQQIEQLYAQMTASDLTAFYAALSRAQLGPQRLLYGDVYGNIAHFRTGRVPIRSELYRWDRPVPGNTSATQWQGFHPQDDLIQVHNPSGGWIQDCNAAPDRITPYSSILSEGFPAYIYNHIPGPEKARSLRAKSLLAFHSRITLSEAKNLALDTYIIHSEHWLRALNRAYASHETALQNTYPDLGEAVEILNRWNGRADPEETGITLYTRWQQTPENRSIDKRQIFLHQNLTETTQQTLLHSLGKVTQSLKNRYGRLQVYWKEIHRFRRNDRSWALPGSWGPNQESLRTVYTKKNGPIDDGTGGQACTTLIQFLAPGHIEAYSHVPFGQTNNPSSPHSHDQAASLFSQNRFKPTGFRQTPGSNLNLQITLTVPPNLETTNK